jgi:SAM-dependent methyltransferase
MLEQEVPIEYVETYYENRIERRRMFLDARLFYEEQLKNVTGDRVVNLGCGPQFFDDLRHFGSLPREYSGLDLNQQNLAFVKTSAHHELAQGKAFALENNVKTDLTCGDILDDNADTGPVFENIDCAVSIGFLGIFTEEPFKKAIRRISSWLAPGGRLVNLSWCGNYQDKNLYEDRLKYRFNFPDNPGHDDIIRWVTACGLTLKHEALFNVPDKEAYGWEGISSSVYELSS